MPSERAERGHDEGTTLAYPSGIRLTAFILMFLSASSLFRAIGETLAAIEEGNRVKLALGLGFVAFLGTMLAVAVGLFWFKEWARSLGVGLMAVAIVLAVGGLLSRPAPGAAGLLILYAAAAGSVLYYITRPHVKAYFRYMS